MIKATRKLAFFFMTAWLSFAQAETPPLLESKNCVLCHTLDKRIIGPSYKEIAKKYQDDKEAKDRLALNIVGGSSGVWGKLAAPASPQVSEEEAKALAAWILLQK